MRGVVVLVELIGLVLHDGPRFEQRRHGLLGRRPQRIGGAAHDSENNFIDGQDNDQRQDDGDDCKGEFL